MLHCCRHAGLVSAFIGHTQVDCCVDANLVCVCVRVRPCRVGIGAHKILAISIWYSSLSLVVRSSRIFEQPVDSLAI
jgi:hypothetical protein